MYHDSAISLSHKHCTMASMVWLDPCMSALFFLTNAHQRAMSVLTIQCMLQVLWCVGCRRAIAWSLMADAESPRTLFELLWAFFPIWLALRLSYDNGCNFLTFVLNREPRWAAIVRVLIDKLHYAGHKQCASSFCTGTRISLRCDCCAQVATASSAFACARL